jgi:glycosyltransferase involved in cell wall biosynthesis
VKLGLVVQRYGAKINGGAELHARYIAELLAKHHKVEVLTTCASDYITWRNELPEGTETLRGVTIRRFPVSREREPRQFAHHSKQVFERRHSLADELSWLDSEGPTSPALIEHVRTHADDYDYVIFFSYRYYQAYHGARAVPGKAILVPTAERDAAMGLGIFGPLFRGVRAIMYNSHEERAMIRAVAHNDQVPGVIVGVGSDVPRATSPERFRKKYDVRGPFVIYVGRIDENKGCKELFEFFSGYRPSLSQRLQLLLIGNSILPIPDHPSIRHLGYVSDQDKFDAIAASDALMMPSYYESLSMVALEAWALGRPVLANGKCDVLRGQCIRSRAGLYYENYHEFCETLFTLTTNQQLNDALGENGRRFYEQHYAWPVIERKYLDVLKRLQQDDAAGRRPGGMEPLPGWLTRHRGTQPPSSTIVDALPHGAAEGDASTGLDAPAPAAAVSGSNATNAANFAGASSGSRSADAGSTSSAPAGASSTYARSTGSPHSSLGRPSQGRGHGHASSRSTSASAPSSERAPEGASRDSGRGESGRGAGRDSGRSSSRDSRESREPREGREKREGRESRPPRDRERDRNRDKSGGGGNPSGSQGQSGSSGSGPSGSSGPTGAPGARGSSRPHGGRGPRGRGGRSGGPRGGRS